jgi:hypothetical protein
VDAQVARKAVDARTELEPTVPIGEALRRTATGLGRRLGLDTGDLRLIAAPSPRADGVAELRLGPRRAGRRPIVAGSPCLGWGVPTAGPPEPVRLPRRRCPRADGVAGLRLGPRRVGRRPALVGSLSRRIACAPSRLATRRRWRACRRVRPRRRAAHPAEPTAATPARPPTSRRVTAQPPLRLSSVRLCRSHRQNPDLSPPRRDSDRSAAPHRDHSLHGSRHARRRQSPDRPPPVDPTGNLPLPAESAATSRSRRCRGATGAPRLFPVGQQLGSYETRNGPPLAHLRR